MSTLTRKPRTVKPATGTCSLAITINGQSYQVIPLQPHPEVASKAIRLKKEDGTVYDLTVALDGQQKCDCPDFIYHRDGKDHAGCKHLKSARAVGLLPCSPPALPIPAARPFKSREADFA